MMKPEKAAPFLYWNYREKYWEQKKQFQLTTSRIGNLTRLI